MNSSRIALLVVVLSLLACVSRGQTAFTYQGELTSGGVNVTGQEFLRFRLYDAETGGNQVGPNVDSASTPITNGRFTVNLDFGSVFLAGQPLWLEIAVKTPIGKFDRIEPRTAVTPTPLAQGLAGFTITKSGAEAIDQDQTTLTTPTLPQPFLDIAPMPPTWQSFTSGRTGILKAQFSLAFQGPAAMTVNVRSGLGNSGQLLGSAFINTKGVVTVSFGNLLVQTGQVYTFTFEGSAWLAGHVVPIAGAHGYSGNGDINWWFRTLVTPVNSIDAFTPYSSEAGRAAIADAAAVVPWSGVTGIPSNIANPPWSTAAGGIAYTHASVGINTPAPQSKLHVSAGDFRLDTNSRIIFGGNGENGDTVYLSRFNYTSGQSGIAMEVGSNGQTPSNNDTFIITAAGQTYFQFNTQGGGQALKPGGGAWGVLSDAREKHDIAPLNHALDQLLKLRGRTYWYNDPTAPGAGSGRRIGFVAQEVEPFFPDWIGETSRGTKTLNITGFEALTVEALRDLRKEKDAEIAELRKRLDEEAKRNAGLEERLRVLETKAR